MSNLTKIEQVVKTAELDLHTLNEWSIQTNPERLERPLLAIKLLSKMVDYLAKEASDRDEAWVAGYHTRRKTYQTAEDFKNAAAKEAMK